MQFEKTDKICCVVLRFRIYILLLTTYARLLCILLKSLSIVILEFDDKFSQSSRFCWGSNFSLSLNLEPQSYLVPDFKNKIDLSPDISGIARYLSPPFCRGSFGGYTEGFLFTDPDWRLFQGLGGDNERNDHELGLVIKVNTA